MPYSALIGHSLNDEAEARIFCGGRIRTAVTIGLVKGVGEYSVRLLGPDSIPF